MQISLRSYLTAGTVAVVGAGAIAMTPLVNAPAPLALPVPVAAEVALTGLTVPDVLGTLDGLGVAGGLPEVFAALQKLLPNELVTSVLSEFMGQANALFFTTATDVIGYVGTALAGLLVGPDSIPARFGGALVAIPGALVAAVQALGTGDLPSAGGAFINALTGPAAGIATAILDAGQKLQDFLTAETNGLITALPTMLFGIVQKVITNNLHALTDSINATLIGIFGPPAVSPAAAVAAVALPTAAAPVVAASRAAAAAASEAVEVSAGQEGTAPATAAVDAERGAAATVSAPRSSRAARHAAAPAAAAASVSADAADAAAPRSESSAQPASGKAAAARGGHASR